MENASKALIIAGAILLSILIIGLGMMVFNQAKEALTGANLDADKAQAFNSKFLEYTGDSVTGVQVKNLIDLVINNNNTVDTTENPTITFMENNINVTMSALRMHRNQIKNAQRYTVTVEGYDTEGRINKIKIKANP